MSDGQAPSPAQFDPDAFRIRLHDLARTLPAADVAGDRAMASVGRLARRLSAALARPMRVAVVGEANVGKTTLVNRLLGQDVLVSDVIENTRLPVIVRYARTPELALIGHRGEREPIAALPVDAGKLSAARHLELSLPLSRLQQVEIVDTPALDPEFEPDPRRRRIAGNPDVAVWVTLATQAWRASEVQICRYLAVPVERALLVASHADLLAEADRPRVLARLGREAGQMFCGIAMSGENGGTEGAAQAVAVVDATVARLDADRCRRAALSLRRRLEVVAPEPADGP